MGQILVTLNGRSYRLACGDGEEVRLQSLAAIVKAKVDQLAVQFGQVGEERLFLMAALLIADELLDARERLTLGDDGRKRTNEASTQQAIDAAQGPPAAGLRRTG